MIAQFSLDTVLHFLGRVHHFGDFWANLSELITPQLAISHVVIIDMNLTDFFKIRRMNELFIAP
jgi:hypothetical protein